MSQHPTLTDKELLDMLPTIQLKDEAPKPQVWLTRKDAFAFARSAFARGVAACQEAMQEEIARLTEHLAERGVALVFQGEQLQKAVAKRDELRAKLKALEEQKPVGYVDALGLHLFRTAPNNDCISFREIPLRGDVPLYLAVGATQGETK